MEHVLCTQACAQCVREAGVQAEETVNKKQLQTWAWMDVGAGAVRSAKGVQVMGRRQLKRLCHAF